MVEQAFLVGDGQHLHFLFILDGGKLDVPFFVSEEMEFNAVAVHHLQDDEQVLYSLAAQCLEFRDDELLDILFNDAGFLAEGREKMILQDQRVSRNGGQFDKLHFVRFPQLGDLTKCFLFCHNNDLIWLNN